MCPTMMAASFLSLMAIFFLFLSAVTSVQDFIMLLEWEISNMSQSPLFLMIIMDKECFVMGGVICSISSAVMGFSKSYMKEDIFIKRFTLLVLLFVLSMIFLIFIPNIITMLIGWDGLGITSFLLVVYYSNPRSISAGMITVLSNRIGDALIMISISCLIMNSHWCISLMLKDPFSLYVSMSVLIAACTKSAQMPFSAWLPAAMAAPTPVSALVHSSTLVTAGVFLLIRFYPVLGQIKSFNKGLMITAVLTMLMASVSAVGESDMKKIIALSTLSQLSVMMMSISMSSPAFSLFHLMSHAMFKALLFMCAGNIISLNSHNQDVRSAGYFFSMPLNTSALVISSLALCGFPFMSAFYSKDLILEASLIYSIGLWEVIMFSMATSMTCLYSFRLLYTLLWMGNMSLSLNCVNEEQSSISGPMLFLSLAAIMVGSFLNWLLIAPSTFMGSNFGIKMIIMSVCLMGVLGGIKMMNWEGSMGMRLPLFFIISLDMWFMNSFSKQAMMKNPLYFGFFFSSSIDQGWQEVMGGQGLHYMMSYPKEKIVSLKSLMVSKQILLSFLVLGFMYLSF